VFGLSAYSRRRRGTTEFCNCCEVLFRSALLPACSVASLIFHPVSGPAVALLDGSPVIFDNQCQFGAGFISCHCVTNDQIRALRTMFEAEQIFDGCIKTHDALARCCCFFRQFDHFEPAISYQKIGQFWASMGRRCGHPGRSF
jgi:hypothetical protein